jgi:hypothetical protein
MADESTSYCILCRLFGVVRVRSPTKQARGCGGGLLVLEDAVQMWLSLSRYGEYPRLSLSLILIVMSDAYKI